jgi:hypothetical protein
MLSVKLTEQTPLSGDTAPDKGDTNSLEAITLMSNTKWP